MLSKNELNNPIRVSDMSMRNLLRETIRVLKENGKSPQDVIWVGNTEEFSISWEEFDKIADFEYDAAFGSVEVCGDLLVVGADFWLERHEYDGSEWWEFKTLPKQPKNAKKFHNIRAHSYEYILANNQGEPE